MSVTSIRAASAAAPVDSSGVALPATPLPDAGDTTAPHTQPIEPPANSGAANVATDGTEADPFPPTFTDPQGRVFTRRVDAATGHLQYVHESNRSQGGSTLQVAIVIDLAPDGTYSRNTRQQLSLANGDRQVEQVVARFDAAGKQVEETLDSSTTTAQQSSTEHTVTSYTDGKPTRRETDFQRTQKTPADKSGATSSSEIDISATWYDEGRPLSSTLVPQVERIERGHYVTPGQGINKDTPRHMHTEARATGPLNALVYDDHMKLVVRFDGHGKQYIERELKIPIVNGEPDMSKAEQVRNEDHQSGYVKALTQARIWGGFSSSMLANVAILGRGFLGKSARAVLWAGVAAGAAEVTGEVHAMVTRRNDASSTRLVMGIYDTLWLGGYAWLTRPRGVLGAAFGANAFAGKGGVLTAAGIGASSVGLAANGTQLLNGEPLLTGFRSGVLGGKIGQDLLPPSGSLPRVAGFTTEADFDTVRALAPAL